MKKYISKGEWFDKGTEAKLICQYLFKEGDKKNSDCNVGIFEGIRNGKVDEEGCDFDEFDIIEVEDGTT